MALGDNALPVLREWTKAYVDDAVAGMGGGGTRDWVKLLLGMTATIPDASQFADLTCAPAASGMWSNAGGSFVAPGSYGYVHVAEAGVYDVSVGARVNMTAADYYGVSAYDPYRDARCCATVSYQEFAGAMSQILSSGTHRFLLPAGARLYLSVRGSAGATVVANAVEQYTYLMVERVG